MADDPRDQPKKAVIELAWLRAVPKAPSRIEVLSARLNRARSEYLSVAECRPADARRLRSLRAEVREWELALKAALETEANSFDAEKES